MPSPPPSAHPADSKAGAPPPPPPPPLENTLGGEKVDLSTVITVEDFFAFCKRVSPKHFESIVHEGQLVQYGPDSIVYLQGEISDAFYVINDGAVEIVVANEEGLNPAPLTRLTKGALFGETSLLTDGQRTASVRVPESATLLKFSRDTFVKLLGSIPAFGHYLAVILSRRLLKTTAQLHFYSTIRELSGSLDFFDLPTIFQTISLSQQHGIMHIVTLTQEIIGEFAFANGSPISARFRHLYGIEALLDLFQDTPHANFGFTRSDDQPVVEGLIFLPNVNEFTMQAVHLRDEYLGLLEKLKIPEDLPVKRIHSQIQWSDPALEGCAKEMWSSLTQSPAPLKQLVTTLPYCHYHILKVLDTLFETGQVAYAEITPYGYR